MAALVQRKRLSPGGFERSFLKRRALFSKLGLQGFVWVESRQSGWLLISCLVPIDVSMPFQGAAVTLPAVTFCQTALLYTTDPVAKPGGLDRVREVRTLHLDPSARTLP